MTDQAPTTPAAKVFISYSRKDKEFIRKLHDALKAQGFELWVDWEGIALGTEWWKEIVEGIEGCDQFIFLISPDSVTSQVCADELQKGIEHNKQLVPVLIREEKGMMANVRPELQAINFTFMRTDEEFERTLPQLVELLNTDLRHVKQHTHLQGRALDWERRNRSNSGLLRGDALEQAEAWQVQASGKHPARTALQAEYIQLSRKDATQRQRRFLFGVSVAFVIMVVLAIFSVIGFRDARIAQATALANEFRAETQQVLAEHSAETAVANQHIAATQQTVAEEQKAIADTERTEADKQRGLAEVNAAEAMFQREIAEARELASESLAFLQKGDLLSRSILLTINSLRKHPTGGGDQALRQGLDLLPTHLARITSPDAAFTQISYSPDGEWLVAADTSGNVHIYNASSNEEVIQLSHGGRPIAEFVFHPTNPQLLATAGNDGVARLWSITTGELVAQFVHNSAVNAVAFSPNGLWLGTGTADGSARTWTLTTYRQIAIMGHQGAVLDMAYSSGSSWVASVAEDGTIKVWAATTGAVMQQIYLSSPVNLVLFHPSNFYFLTASQDGTVVLWNAESGGQVFQFSHQQAITSMTFNFDASLIATSSTDDTARLWDARTGFPLGQYPHDDDVYAVAFSPDGQKLATASADNTARIWKVNTGRELARAEHHGVVSIAFFRNNFILATAGEDHVSIWSDEQLGQAVYSLYYAPGFKDLDFDPTETRITAATLDHKVLVWELASGQILLKIEVGSNVIDVDYSKDGTLIATAGEDGRACMWDSQTGEKVECFVMDGAVQDVDFSRDGSWLITGSLDGAARIWDLSIRAQYRVFTMPGPVYEVSLHPDGNLLLVSSAANEAVVWDITKNEPALTLVHPAPVLLVNFIAEQGWVSTVAADNSIRIWDMETGLLVEKFLNDSDILSAEIGPNSETIAIASEDNTAHILNFFTKEEVARIVHTDQINDVTFNGDGTMLATASSDGRILVSVLEPEVLTEKACSRLQRNLTEDEWNQYVTGDYALTCPNLPVDPAVIATLFSEAGHAGIRGETEAALALLERALALDASLNFDPEEQLEIAMRDAYISEVRDFFFEGRFANAFAKLQQLQTRYPEAASENYLGLLALLCIDQIAEGFEEQKIAVCDQAIALEAAKPEYLYFGRGIHHAKLGSLPAAIADLQTARPLFEARVAAGELDLWIFITQIDEWLGLMGAGTNPFEQ